MPEHVFTVAALGHAVDAQTNNLTLFSVLEHIGTVSFPVAIPQFSVVTLWRRKNGEEGVSFLQRTRLLNPQGEEVFHLDQEFRLDKPRHRCLCNIGMAPFESAGEYTVETQISGAGDQAFSTVHVYPLEVSLAKASEDSLLAEAES